MGDACDQEKPFFQDLKVALPNSKIFCIRTGSGIFGDVLSSYFGDSNRYIKEVCDEVLSTPELQSLYIGIGMSQGGQFLRGLLQKCQHRRGPRMHTLISIGGQHQGVMNVPRCSARNPSFVCKLVKYIVGNVVYSSFAQRNIVQAQYFKDPAKMADYTSSSNFLADINAESDHVADSVYEQYRDNILQLEKMVLYQFRNDEMVIPPASSHFGFVAQSGKLLNMEDTPQYHRLGLQQLDAQGKLILDWIPGQHMQFSFEWFSENVVAKYLNVTSPPCTEQ